MNVNTLKLATWNVNSLKIRLEQVLQWLETTNTDILALQETKLTDENFPVDIFKERGYHLAYTGQKTYNGVAIISKHPMEEILIEIPGFADPQRRFLATTIAGVRLINLYVPNGAIVGSDKYIYKLNWLEHVTDFIKEEMQNHENLAIVGDFNIAPEDRDVHDPEEWIGSVLVSEPERNAFAKILALGLNDSLRAFYDESTHYSWWDYRMGSFRRNRGVRIDHILLSNNLKKYCNSCQIDIEPRRDARPSDHTPVIVSLVKAA